VLALPRIELFIALLLSLALSLLLVFGDIIDPFSFSIATLAAHTVNTGRIELYPFGVGGWGDHPNLFSWNFVSYTLNAVLSIVSDIPLESVVRTPLPFLLQALMIYIILKQAFGNRNIFIAASAIYLWLFSIYFHTNLFYIPIGYSLFFLGIFLILKPSKSRILGDTISLALISVAVSFTYYTASYILIMYTIINLILSVLIKRIILMNTNDLNLRREVVMKSLISIIAATSALLMMNMYLVSTLHLRYEVIITEALQKSLELFLQQVMWSGKSFALVAPSSIHVLLTFSSSMLKIINYFLLSVFIYILVRDLLFKKEVQYFYIIFFSIILTILPEALPYIVVGYPGLHNFMYRLGYTMTTLYVFHRLREYISNRYIIIVIYILFILFLLSHTIIFLFNLVFSLDPSTEFHYLSSNKHSLTYVMNFSNNNEIIMWGDLRTVAYYFFMSVEKNVGRNVIPIYPSQCLKDVIYINTITIVCRNYMNRPNILILSKSILSRYSYIGEPWEILAPIGEDKYTILIMSHNAIYSDNSFIVLYLVQH